jgi:hypothetical protein
MSEADALKSAPTQARPPAKKVGAHGDGRGESGGEAAALQEDRQESCATLVDHAAEGLEGVACERIARLDL